MTAMHDRARALISQLQLEPHPEGGCFRRIYQSPVIVAPPDGRGARPTATANARCSAATTDDCCELESRLDDIRSALSLAVDELRRLAADFSGVDLAAVSPEAALRKAVERHLKRTETPVRVEISEMPEHAQLSTKITLFRVVQESLHNAFRHADGQGQRVRAWSDEISIWVEISDRGPRFDATEAMARQDCLGLTGLRDRVSILGGRFRVDSDPASGTRVVACLPRVPGVECPDA